MKLWSPVTKYAKHNMGASLPVYSILIIVLSRLSVSIETITNTIEQKIFKWCTINLFKINLHLPAVCNGTRFVDVFIFPSSRTHLPIQGKIRHHQAYRPDDALFKPKRVA
jgi:hypothetical protein